MRVCIRQKQPVTLTHLLANALPLLFHWRVHAQRFLMRHHQMGLARGQRQLADLLPRRAQEEKEDYSTTGSAEQNLVELVGSVGYKQT